jgi:hypothetical protein
MIREIKLSPEELDRYNTKLFPEQYHYKYFPYKYRLIVDGERWEHSVALKSGSDNRVSALLWGDAVRKVEGESLADLAAHFSDLELVLSDIRKPQSSLTFDFLEIRCDRRESSPTMQVVFKVDQDFNLWAAPFSIADFAASIEAAVRAHPELDFQYWQRRQEIQKGFGVSTRVPVNESLGAVLSIASLNDLEGYVEAALAQHKLVRVQFNFPSLVRNACEQYLLYFVQFLSDLGIEAQAELKEEAQKTLFTVVPTDQSQALTQIWKALEVYLHLPGSKEFETAAAHLDDIAVYQLKANLAHLHGQAQLMLAQLQLMRATISVKDTEIALLKERFDLQRFSEPAEPSAKAGDEAEAIVPGYLGVKKLVLWDFLEIELPEMLRKLKRRLGAT